MSVRAVPEYPLFVNISVAENTALAGWLQRSAMIGLGSAALLLCSIYLLIAITRQVRALSNSEGSLLQTSQQLDAALNNMAHGISMFDKNERLVVVNKQYAAMYNLSPEPGEAGHAGARYPRGARRGRRVPGVPQLRRRPPQGDVLGKDYSTIDYLRDGRVIAINHQRMDNGGWVAVHQDITAQKRVEAELAHMARYDALTGLANRALFLEKVNEALARMASHGEPFSILMLDLDRFKAVNDSLGHAIGDSLLKAVGDRLRRLVRDLDVVARLGGDEFAIIQIADTNQRDQADRPRQPHPDGHHRALRHRWPQDRHRHRRSASRSRRRMPTPPMPMCLSATPTSRSTSRNPKAAIAIASSRPPWRRKRATAASSKRTCGARCCATNSSCTTRPSSTSAGASAAAPRRWCAGAIPSAACSPPTSSSAWRRRAA